MNVLPAKKAAASLTALVVQPLSAVRTETGGPTPSAASALLFREAEISGLRLVLGLAAGQCTALPLIVFPTTFFLGQE